LPKVITTNLQNKKVSSHRDICLKHEKTSCVIKSNIENTLLRTLKNNASLRTKQLQNTKMK